MAFRPTLLAPQAGVAGSPRKATREETFTTCPSLRPAMMRAAKKDRFAGPMRFVAIVHQNRTRAADASVALVTLPLAYCWLGSIHRPVYLMTTTGYI
jgi:hypothetical protein